MCQAGIDTSQGVTSEKLLSIFWGKQKESNLNERELSRENKELPMLSFSSISAATGNFSLANKLGEGGFGPVFKVFLFCKVELTNHWPNKKEKSLPNL